MAYIRRWREDLRGKRAESLFANHVANGVIQELTDGKFNEVFYVSGKWFLSSYDPETKSVYPTTHRSVSVSVYQNRNTKVKQLPEYKYSCIR